MKTLRQFRGLMVMATALAVTMTAMSCEDDKNNNNADGGAGDAPGGADLNDSQILGVMMEANTGEVQTGELAVDRSTDPEIIAFANMIITDHSAANTRLMTIGQAATINAAESPQRMMVRTMAMQAENTLEMATAATFDMAFINVQVMLHTATLNMLDTMLIPRATNAQLKAELQMERASVMMHLAHAQMLAQ